jgi:hypothetical protein
MMNASSLDDNNTLNTKHQQKHKEKWKKKLTYLNHDGNSNDEQHIISFPMQEKCQLLTLNLKTTF